MGVVRATRKRPGFAARVAVLALAGSLGGAAGARGGTVASGADRLLAQPDSTSNVLHRPTARGLFVPSGVARDGAAGDTRLFVADTFNSRVLGFECAGSDCVVPP